MDVIQRERLLRDRHRILDQRGQVVVVDKFFLIADFLEPLEDRAGFLLGELEAQMVQSGEHRVASAVLRQRQLGREDEGDQLGYSSRVLK